jgi:spore germination protein KA
VQEVLAMAAQTKEKKQSQSADSNLSSPLSGNLEEDLQLIGQGLGNSMDLIIRRFKMINPAPPVAVI